MIQVYMGELRNKCVANIPDWWSNYTVNENVKKVLK